MLLYVREGHTTDKLHNWCGNPHGSTKGYLYLSIHLGLYMYIYMEYIYIYILYIYVCIGVLMEF